MAEVDAEYSERFSHTTVSRWESGTTRPTVERLQVFGKALHLTEDEVTGLIVLAGLADDYESASDQSWSRDEPLFLDAENDRPIAAVRLEPAPPLLRQLGRYFAFRFLLPGVLITGFHYVLSLLGWNNTWMPVACVAFACLVVLGPGFVLRDERAGLREFYRVSVFFVLTTPLLQFAPLGLDHYNFHLVAGLGGTMLPYLLALLVNLGLSWVAGLGFYLLWRRRYQDGTTVGGTVTGAASVTIPPVAVVYSVVLVITNFSVTVQLSAVFAVLPMAFSLLLVFRDAGVEFTERDQRALFQAMVAAGCVSVAVGIAVIMSIYLSPDFPSVLPGPQPVGFLGSGLWRLGVHEGGGVGSGEPGLHLARHVSADLHVLRCGWQVVPGDTPVGGKVNLNRRLLTAWEAALLAPRGYPSGLSVRAVVDRSGRQGMRRWNTGQPAGGNVFVPAVGAEHCSATETLVSLSPPGRMISSMASRKSGSGSTPHAGPTCRAMSTCPMRPWLPHGDVLIAGALSIPPFIAVDLLLGFLIISSNHSPGWMALIYRGAAQSGRPGSSRSLCGASRKVTGTHPSRAFPTRYTRSRLPRPPNWGGIGPVN